MAATPGNKSCISTLATIPCPKEILYAIYAVKPSVPKDLADIELPARDGMQREGLILIGLYQMQLDVQIVQVSSIHLLIVVDKGVNT